MQYSTTKITRARFRFAVNMGGPVIDDVNLDHPPHADYTLGLVVHVGATFVQVTRGATIRWVPMTNVIDISLVPALDTMGAAVLPLRPWTANHLPMPPPAAPHKGRK